ncbi:MAG: hypothetical protein QM496_12605 [Verrucomicrobiota bacterium]
MRPVIYILILCLLSAAGSQRAQADAIVINRSMKASTIAEIFVERDRIRVEMEIGIVDFGAFQNMLPDELFEKLDNEPKALKERYGDFFQQDWVLRADGKVLVPALKSIEGKQRSRRDEITGEVITNADEENDVILSVILEYALGVNLPKALSIKAPTSKNGHALAAIGFVLYHEGLAVNDFRYLSTEAIIDLDWEDPWYSKFKNNNLKRQYDAPLHGFLYAEPREIRKEIIARVRDLEQWIDLCLDGKETISPDEQKAILKKIGVFLADRCPLTIDGKVAQGQLDRIHFVRRTLRQTTVVGTDEELPVVSAMIGAIFVYPTTGLPQQAAMKWDLFTKRTPMMKGVATDEAGGLPSTVTPDDPILVWKNFLKNPTDSSLIELTPPPARAQISIPLTFVLAFVLTFWLMRRQTRHSKLRRVAWGVVVTLAVLTLLPLSWIPIPSPFSGESNQTPEQNDAVAQGLLRNIYRSFDYREESDVYDALEQSVSGELLTTVYLEVQKALQLKNQGGASTKVKEVELIQSEVQPAEAGFVTRCQWTVLGSVGHWGHIHQRKNRYDAVLTIQAVDGVWKLTTMELKDEERL